MKILYGVQATGNGHITRARCLGPALERAGATVDYLFSGRPRQDLFEMAPFGDFIWREGLTFVVRHGRLQPLQTLRRARLRRLARDIRQLDTSEYDLVITDFEPVTAWAARSQGTPSIGIGHQYAFRHRIPFANANLPAWLLMRWFAPAGLSLGSHWYHFDQPILPPLVEPPSAASQSLPDPHAVLVYLPFDEAGDVLATLRQIDGYRFHFFTAQLTSGLYGPVHVHPPGRASFQARLQQCPSVICGAGFELASEALSLGRRLLVKPTNGQMEQESNALALQQLGWGDACDRLNSDRVRHWLKTGRATRVIYPDVADVLARWLVAADRPSPEALCRELWGKASFGAGQPLDSAADLQPDEAGTAAASR